MDKRSLKFRKLLPEHMPLLTSEGVRLKIRNLEAKYKKLKKHNDTTGNEPKMIPESLEDAFGEKHKLANLHTIDSSSVSSTRQGNNLYIKNVT